MITEVTICSERVPSASLRPVDQTRPDMANFLFLVTAYKETAHLGRLCKTLLALDPTAHVVVQWDRSQPPPSDLPASVELRITAHAIEWGDGTYAMALLESARKALERPWRWLVVLSGQDYPIRPVQELEAYLDATGAAGVGVSVQVPRPSPDEWSTASDDVRRYWARYWWLPERCWRTPTRRRFAAAAGRALTALPLLQDRVTYRARPYGATPGIGLRWLRAPFDGYPCRKGSDYVALDRHALHALVTVASQETVLVRHLMRCAIPSEALFHTLLYPHVGEALLQEHLHYARWSGSHPLVLEPPDFSALASSGRFFARKFDRGSNELLARIDTQLLHLVDGA